MGTVRILRVYEEPEPGEYRILVDRLWPRGIKKDKVGLWPKEAGPSNEVRNAFVRDHTVDLQAKACSNHYGCAFSIAEDLPCALK